MSNFAQFPHRSLFQVDSSTGRGRSFRTWPVRGALALACSAILAACGGGGGSSAPAPTPTYTIGGTVAGLAGGTHVVLKDNGADALTVSANGAFTFTTAVAANATYSVAVGTQPTGETCTVSAHSGTVAAVNITTVSVVCSAITYTVGGTVSGLTTGAVILKNNGADPLTVSANGSFTFSTPVAYNSGYAVTVGTQPAGQFCTLTNATGSGVTANVSSVGVACSQSNLWTWTGGPNVVNASGTYGTLGSAAAANVPGARDSAATWTDSAGNFWLFGGEGSDSIGTVGYLNDLWEYSVTLNQWIWVSGSNTANVAGTYGTLGAANGTTNFPGARYGATTWTDTTGGNLWLFGGYTVEASPGVCNDLWKYNITTGFWTWVAGSNTCASTGTNGTYGTINTPSSTTTPGARAYAASWIDPTTGKLFLFGGKGFDAASAEVGTTGTAGYLNDLWMFYLGQWTWVSGSNVVGDHGTYPSAPLPQVGTPSARDSASTWRDASGNFWLFGGRGNDSAGTAGSLNDMWVYGGGGWTWVSGSATVNAQGVYGTASVASTANFPGARYGAIGWIDSGGNLRLFGGLDNQYGLVDEGWIYLTGTAQWAWVSGAPGTSVGTYGTLGVAAPTNLPGAREKSAAWVDASGKLWLFGGYGADSVPALGDLNDLWIYQP
jgi:N-acetylneuraminic acid mutarotase